MTVLFYILTIIFEKVLTLSTIISFPISVILGSITKKKVFSSAVGSFLTFLLYNYLWKTFEGGGIPLILVIIILIGEFALLRSGKLTFSGYTYSKGLMTGKVFFIVYLLNFETIRWF